MKNKNKLKLQTTSWEGVMGLMIIYIVFALSTKSDIWFL